MDLKALYMFIVKHGDETLVLGGQEIALKFCVLCHVVRVQSLLLYCKSLCVSCTLIIVLLAQILEINKIMKFEVPIKLYW